MTLRILATTLALLFLACAPRTLHAATPPLVLHAGTTSFPLTGHIDVLEDKSGKLTIDEVSSPAIAARFKPDNRRVLNFGVTSSVYWLRFSVANDAAAAKRWLLELAFPNMDYLDLYVTGVDGGFDLMRAGDMRPMSIRAFKHRNPVFPLFIDGTVTCYLRADAGGARVVMPLTLWTPDAFASADNRKVLVNGCYFGAMLVMVVYNLFIFLSLRDRNYLYYILDIFCLALFVFAAEGFLLEFVLGEMPEINRYTYIFAELALLTGLLFCRNFLTTRRTAPALDRIMQFLMLGGCIALFAGAVMPVEKFRLLQTALSVGSSATALTTAVVCLRRGVHPARYYLAARIFRIAGVFTFALAMYNLIPLNFLTTSSLQIGSIFEVLLLSFALADRINVMQREKEDAQAEALRASHLASIGELAAGVAHEINTPVNTIINSADLILENRDRRDTERDVEVIKKEGRRIATIARSLLFYSRRPDREKVPFAVTELLQGTMDILGARLRREKVTVSVRVLPDIGDVSVHPQQIEQVFLNVLTNAMHALGERHGDTGGVKNVEIAAAGVRIGSRSFVRVTFRDNGVGIPAALLEQVKEPFVTTKKTGAGLGLSISRRIIDEHGGDIGIDSREGDYTEIRIDLPVAA